MAILHRSNKGASVMELNSFWSDVTNRRYFTQIWCSQISRTRIFTVAAVCENFRNISTIGGEQNMKIGYVLTCTFVVIMICFIYLHKTEQFEITSVISFAQYRISMKNGVVSRKGLRYLLPQCDNLLHNITDGRWMSKISMLERWGGQPKDLFLLKSEEAEMMTQLQQFWIRKGMGESFVRPDNACGYAAHQNQSPDSDWPSVGSWCNKYSDQSCCDNLMLGKCISVSAKNCSCPECVDMRQQVLAELSDWITTDPRCIWRNYSSDEACSVIAKSPYDNIYFSGDSLARNFQGALLMILANDPVRGSRPNGSLVDEICAGPQRFYWKQCRVIPQMPWTIHCRQQPDRHFNISRPAFKNANGAQQFLDFIRKIVGVPKTVVLLSFGNHFDLNANSVIDNLFVPALRIMDEYYSRKVNSSSKTVQERWPHFITLSTQQIGLLKPEKYIRRQNTKRNDIFNQKLREFSHENGFMFLDLVPLTTNVLSFDGTHHALAVNMMKVQFFLNYLATLKT